MSRFNQWFTNQKTEKVETTTLQQSLHTMRTWIRKVEQSTQSISDRLNAVERHLSIKEMDADKERVHDIFLKYENEEHVEEDQSGVINKMEQVSALSDEIESLSSYYLKQEFLILEFKSEIKDVKQELSRLSTQLIKDKDQMRNRLDSIEHSSSGRSILMKVKGKEIPLEVSGIIGGILAFFSAGIIAIGGKSIVVSPLFLTGIGVLLIASAMIRLLST